MTKLTSVKTIYRSWVQDYVQVLKYYVYLFTEIKFSNFQHFKIPAAVLIVISGEFFSEKIIEATQRVAFPQAPDNEPSEL